MSLTKHLQYGRKTVAGKPPTGDHWEVIQFRFPHYEMRINKLEEKYYIAESVRIGFHDEYKLKIHKKDERVFVELKGRCRCHSVGTAIVSILDQDGVAVWQARVGKDEEFRYELDNETIINSSNNILDGGELVIEVYLPTLRCSGNFVPRNQFNDNMIKLMTDEESADVAFKVEGACNYHFSGDDDLDNCRNILCLFGNQDDELQTYEIIYAHKVIIKANAPFLASICDGFDKENPVPLGSVEPGVLRLVLRYLYGGKIPYTVLKNRSKVFIEAANRFDIIGIKIEAEAFLVEHGVINVDNFLDVYHFACTMSCPLLKEAAEEYFYKHSVQVLQSSAYKEIRDTPELAFEFLRLVTDSSRFSARQQKTVDEMRRSLYEMGLSIDGTKSMLAARLNKASSNSF